MWMPFRCMGFDFDPEVLVQIPAASSSLFLLSSLLENPRLQTSKIAVC
jgi:hypothetical protein